jgi:general secretion pathway protein A
MYAAFYGLKREPFSIAPDPHFLFMSEAHREALAHLLYGVTGGGGFVLLTGEIGAGKTTVCRCFLEQVPALCDVAYVFNPKLSVPELLRTVCEEFRIGLPAGAATVKDFVDPLNGFLLASHAAGRHSVLIIDEAQSLSAELLEQLRLLTNLETAERKLLQIMLIGQPELREMLGRHDLEQLAQRVTARYHLPALSEAETALYVHHRLQVAGLGAERLFDAAALRRIHALCGGVPRRINLLCDRALLGGYAGSRQRIDRATVEQAAREVFGLAPRRARGTAGWALAAGGAMAVFGATALWWSAQRPPSDAPAAAASVAGAASGAPAASAAAAAASGAPTAVAPADRPADAAEVLAAAHRTEAAAWRELASLWPLALDDGEPCEAAVRAQAACWRGTLGLAALRALGRPGVLTLYRPPAVADAVVPGTPGPGAAPLHVVIVGLADGHAMLRLDGQDRTVPLTELAGLWRGDFGTVWRPPPGFGDSVGGRMAPALEAWLAERLPEPAGAPLASRVQAFQVAHGLRPDGRAGPMTLMQVQRVLGADGPPLRSGRAGPDPGAAGGG